MRLAVSALSAVLLSGCSWFGFGGDRAYYDNNGQAYYYGNAPAPQNPYGTNGYGVQNAPSSHAYGNFPQQPDFRNGYGSGSYGSHAANAGQYGASQTTGKKLKKPKLRGSLSLGLEKGSGNYLEYAKIPTLDPSSLYDPNVFAEGSIEGTASAGLVTTTTYTAAVEDRIQPDISTSDVYSTPLRVAGGLEYILSPHATIFANGGYSYAEGNRGRAATVNGTLLRTRTAQAFDPMTLAPVGGPQNLGTTFIPNIPVAHFDYDFSDMRRYDLEVGGRYYFDPIVNDQEHRTVTPFVSASAGMAHHNSQSLTVSQDQLFYTRAFESTSNPRTLDYYNVAGPPQVVQLYDSQWIPTGSLTAGMEWQVTPKTAFALETGVKYEGGRDYSNGSKGSANIAIPVTLRGSFNF